MLVSGEGAREPPQVWTRIEIVYRLTGKLDEKAVRDAIELSQTKYCSVAAMLGKTAKITYRYEILPATLNFTICEFRVLACHAGARLHTIADCFGSMERLMGRRHCREDYRSGRIRSAARGDELRSRKNRGHER